MVEDDYVELPPITSTNWNAVLKKEVPVQKVKPATMWPCLMCEKITRSHIFPDGTVLCHGCYETMSEDELAVFRSNHEVKRFATDSG